MLISRKVQEFSTKFPERGGRTADGLMKTGRTESEEPSVVPMPELGLDADEVDESVDMAPDQIDRR